MFVGINYLAVAVCAIFSMILGFFWYGPGYGKAWMRLVGLKAEDINPNDAVKGYIYSVVFSFITALVLAIFMKRMQITGALSGFCLGAVIGVVFVAFTLFNNDMYEQRPVKLSLINSGYRVVYLMVIGAVLGAWQ